jgi:hypothetical protein
MGSRWSLLYEASGNLFTVLAPLAAIYFDNFSVLYRANICNTAQKPELTILRAAIGLQQLRCLLTYTNADGAASRRRGDFHA